MKSFGCLAFAHNPTSHKDKFKPRVVPFVFLGYPMNNKGYTLLNLLNKKISTSRDVKCHEDIFLNNIHSFQSPYKHPLSVSMPNATQPNTIPYTLDFNLDLADQEEDTKSALASPPGQPSPTKTKQSPLSNHSSPIPPPPVPQRTLVRLHKEPSWLADYECD